jgi:hypothetical protein
VCEGLAWIGEVLKSTSPQTQSCSQGDDMEEWGQHLSMFTFTFEPKVDVI